MILATHKTYALIPITIIDVNSDTLLDKVWKVYPDIKEEGLDRGGVIQKETNICRLDSGGILNEKELWYLFSVGGYYFEMQLSKIESISYLISEARDITPECKSIPMWRHRVMCSNKMAMDLLAKITEISSSDAALHAGLDDIELKDRLKDCIEFPSIKKEKDLRDNWEEMDENNR